MGLNNFQDAVLYKFNYLPNQAKEGELNLVLQTINKMSIINDKSNNLNSQHVNKRDLNKLNNKKMSNTCQFLCFRSCGQSPPSEMQADNAPNIKINKLSLKKVIDEQENKIRLVTKSISDKNLIQHNNFKSDTSRSQNQAKQLMLFRKKAKLQNQIEKVDQQMNRLTSKYEKNLSELKAIKRQLQILKNS